MKQLLRRGGWLTGLLIFSMPIALVFYLGVQMAYSEVQSEAESYAALAEYTKMAELQSLPAGATILLRGQIAELASSQARLPAASTEAEAPVGPLLIYQERPLDGREVRFLEEFPLVFPAITVQLADGNVVVESNADDARTISHELHEITIDDRKFTGFQAGDTIMVQGKWQPTTAGQRLPMIVEVTGVSGADKAALQAEVQAGLQKVRLAKDGLGLLTLAGFVLLIIRVYRQRKNPPSSQDEEQASDALGDLEWHPPTSKTVPTT